jgi:hypothetical protein
MATSPLGKTTLPAWQVGASIKLWMLKKIISREIIMMKVLA